MKRKKPRVRPELNLLRGSAIRLCLHFTTAKLSEAGLRLFLAPVPLMLLYSLTQLQFQALACLSQTNPG